MVGAEKLRAYLKRRELTHEAFAALARVPGPQISLWLSGKRNPGLKNALKLETATAGEVRVADWMQTRRVA